MADKRDSEQKHLEPSTGRELPETRSNLASRGLDLALNVRQENERPQPQGLAEDEIILPARTIRFPMDRSIGSIWLRRWNSPIVTWDDIEEASDESWLNLGEARGEFHIPSGGELELSLDYTKIGVPSLAELLYSDDIQHISSLRVDDEVMACLQILTGLLSIIIDSSAAITDEALKCLPSLHNLRRLLLAGNYITDEGLSYLRGLEKLRWLDLEGTWISDAGLANLAHLSNLETLWLGRTYVTEAGCAFIENALPDCNIFMEPSWPYEQDNDDSNDD